MNRHSNDLRIRVISHVKNSNTVASTSRLFKVAISTIRKWVVEDNNNQLTTVKYYNPRKSKIDYHAFSNYIEQNPDKYYREIAEHFQCSKSLAHKLCHKLNITVKKNKPRLEKQIKL